MAKDSLFDDRPSQGQGQEYSRPRPRTKDTSASILQKKRFSKIFFRRSPVKNVFQIFFFQAIYNISTIQKKCCPRAEDRAIFEDLRPRSQGQGLGLQGQGWRLHNVSSRPRTSSRTPPLSIYLTGKYFDIAWGNNLLLRTPLYGPPKISFLNGLS